MKGLSILNRTQILATTALLCILWVGLPVRLVRFSSGPSSAECLTLSDSPPAGRAGIVPSLKRCTALFPNDTELMADLGAEYESAGSLELAEDIYQKAISIDPGYADLRLRLGRLMLRRGAVGEAQRQAEAALRVQPNRTALLDLLAEAARARKQP